MHRDGRIDEQTDGRAHRVADGSNRSLCFVNVSVSGKYLCYRKGIHLNFVVDLFQEIDFYLIIMYVYIFICVQESLIVYKAHTCSVFSWCVATAAGLH